MNYSELILAVTQLVIENQELKNRIENKTHIKEVSEVKGDDYLTHVKAKVFDACVDKIFRDFFNTWNITEYSFEGCLGSDSMQRFLRAGVTMDELKLVFMDTYLSIKAEKQKKEAEKEAE